jgi:hypothetical protein
MVVVLPSYVIPVCHAGLPSTLACCNTLRVANISQNRLPALPSCILACTRLEQLVLSSGPVAGTHDFDRLHKQLPRLRRLQVKVRECLL